MGLLGMIGKMAGSKVVEKVENELTKRQNREQTSKYCTYIKNNIVKICKLVYDLQSDTQSLISGISASKRMKMSFKEKGELRKAKEKAISDLQYLYLSRDFFTVLAKNASGLALQNEELMLVTKFAPYFDGVPVIEMEEKNSDDSVFGAFKEVGKELMSAFVSSPKDSKHFTFKEYLCRYEEKINEYVIPNIDSAMESFKNAMETLEKSSEKDGVTSDTFAIVTPEPSDEYIECPKCNAKLNTNSKFCPGCGNKIEIKKSMFCTQCGEPVTVGSKFCANCGAKV